MSGLCGYPRTRGRNLPPHIAQTLLDQGVINDDDLGMFERHYLDRRVPEFLQATHTDPANQPGAVESAVIDTQNQNRTPAYILWKDENLDLVSEEERALTRAFMTELQNDLQIERMNRVSKWRPILETFTGEVRVVLIKAGARLSRVVGVVIPTNDERWSELRGKPEKIINDPKGSYWIAGSPDFKNEADWRAHCAVKTEWNGDHGYVEHVVEESVFALYGRAAAQTSADLSRVFPGGAHQVAVPFGTFDPTKDGSVPYSELIKPMLWRRDKL